MSDIIVISSEHRRQGCSLCTETGFAKMHWNESRLRTETAALAAVFAAYYNNI